MSSNIRTLWKSPQYHKSLISAVTKSILRSAQPYVRNVVPNRRALGDYISLVLESFSDRSDDEIYRMLSYVATLTPVREASSRVDERTTTVFHILEQTGFTGVNSIADIGCGDGTILRSIGARLGLPPKGMVGVDVLPAAPFGVSYVRADNSLPYNVPPGSIDLVTIFVTLHHIRSRVHIASIRDMVRVGGMVVIREHDCPHDDTELKSYLDVVHGLSETVTMGSTCADFHRDFYSEYLSRDDIDRMFGGWERVYYATYTSNNPQRLYHVAYVKK